MLIYAAQNSEKTAIENLQASLKLKESAGILVIYTAILLNKGLHIIFSPLFHGRQDRTHGFS